MKNLCVFCGSSFGSDPKYAQAAERLGAIIAGRKLGLVYGGGRVGLMGEIADTVIKAKGHVIGVIPKQ